MAYLAYLLIYMVLFALLNYAYSVTFLFFLFYCSCVSFVLIFFCFIFIFSRFFLKKINLFFYKSLPLDETLSFEMQLESLT